MANELPQMFSRKLIERWCLRLRTTAILQAMGSLCYYPPYPQSGEDSDSKEANNYPQCALGILCTELTPQEVESILGNAKLFGRYSYRTIRFLLPGFLTTEVEHWNDGDRRMGRLPLPFPDIADKIEAYVAENYPNLE